MVIDAELMFDEDTAVAADLTSKKVVDLGENGAVLNPLDIQVSLTAGNTSGTIDSVLVQSSADEAFTNPVDEVKVIVSKSVVQTRACVLAQFKSPIKPQNRYVRLKYAGTSPVGGTITAMMTKGVPVGY